MELVDHLTHGVLEIKGRMPWSSNGTFLAEITGDDAAILGVYKPVRGERPLWDFPRGLHRRETAAYELSAAMGLGVVPLTVIRDGPMGEGSVQLFMEADFDQHYFTIYEDRVDLYPQLQALCVLDLVANNTDRKSGHCLLGVDDRVWGIDNGLCFAAEPKLRTVIWEFGGQPIPEPLLESLRALAHEVPTTVSSLLEPEEVDMIALRAERLVDRPLFPIDATGRHYPWPLV
jgi:uncharacterized repeat protein (TIGR03843 family)